jgi:hypothetical protein
MNKQRPQNKNLRPNPEALGVVALEDGEESRPVRVRAKAEVHAWLKGKTAKEIGDLLTALQRQEQD